MAVQNYRKELSDDVIRFFAQSKKQYQLPSFDNVLLRPNYSRISDFSKINLETLLTKEIILKIPIISAAMDTVTEKEMAIEMAINGGIGIIHKNMGIEEQAKQVDKVKRYMSQYIIDPIMLPKDMTIVEMENLKREKGYNFHTFIIVNENKKLVGIITKDTIKYLDEYEKHKKLGEVCIKRENIVSGRPGTNPEQAYEIMKMERKGFLPIIDEKNNVLGMYIFSDLKKIRNKDKNMLNLDEKGRLRVGAAISPVGGFMDRVYELKRKGVDVIVIDSSHGYHEDTAKAIKRIKQNYDIEIIAGNVATGEGALFLAKAKADAVKVGIGPGSICTTREVTGYGVPQLYAVFEVAYSLMKKGYHVPVIADGGIKSSGDIVKALAAGADSVMLGNLLAGTKEAPGEIFDHDGKTYKTYRGMGSIGAMKQGSKDRYFQQNTRTDKLVPEGIEGAVEYKGPVRDVLHYLIGGIKAGLGHSGQTNINDFRKTAVMYMQNTSETNVHNVDLIKSPPNMF